MKDIAKLGILIGFIAFVLIPISDISSQEKKEEEEEKLEFVGAMRCKMCHNLKSTGKFYDDWEEGPHAKAFELLSEEEQKNPDCVKCHTTGYGEPGGFKSIEDKGSKKMVGVQCEMCHGPGEKHIKSRRGKKVIPHAWELEEEVCTKCHREEGNPNWDPKKYKLENGETTGFDFEQAVKKVNHSKVIEALKKEEEK